MLLQVYGNLNKLIRINRKLSDKALDHEDALNTTKHNTAIINFHSMFTHPLIKRIFSK